MVICSAFADRHAKQLDAMLSRLIDNGDLSAIHELVNSKVLERMITWRFDGQAEKDPGIVSKLSNCLTLLFDEVEKIIKKYNLFWKSASEHGYSTLKHWPEKPAYVPISSEDAYFVEDALRLITLFFQNSFENNRKNFNCVNRAGNICVSLLFVINNGVAMQTLQTFLFLISGCRYSPALGLYHMLSEWIMSVPCDLGLSFENDGVTMLGYLEGTAKPEQLKKLIITELPDVCDLDHPITDHKLASNFRFRASFDDPISRAQLIAIQAYSMSGLALISDYTELNSLLSHNAPKALSNIVDLYLMPFPEDPVLCSISNMMRTAIIDSVILMISAVANHEELMRKYRLPTLVYAFRDKHVSDDYFCTLVAMFEALIPYTNVSLIQTLVEISTDPSYSTLRRARSMTAIYNLMSHVEVTNIASEPSITSYLKGLSQDLKEFCDIHERETSAQYSQDNDLSCCALLDMRLEVLLLCMDMTIEAIDASIQEVPHCYKNIYNTLRSPVLLEMITSQASLGLSRIGAAFLINDHARGEIPDGDLRNIIYETASAIIKDPKTYIVDNPMYAASFLLPLIRVINHVNEFMDVAQVKDSTNTGEVGSLSFRNLSVYIIEGILRLVSRNIGAIESDKDVSMFTGFDTVSHFEGINEFSEDFIVDAVLPRIFTPPPEGEYGFRDPSPKYNLIFNLIGIFVRNNFQLPVPLAKMIIEDMITRPVMDFTYFSKTPHILPLDAFHALTLQGRSNFSLAIRLRELYQWASKPYPNSPELDSSFNDAHGITSAILSELGVASKAALPAWLESQDFTDQFFGTVTVTGDASLNEVAQFLSSLEKPLAKEVFELMVKWCVANFERCSSDSETLEEKNTEVKEIFFATLMALFLMNTYFKKTEKKDGYLWTRDDMLNFMRCALKIKSKNAPNFLEFFSRLGSSLPPLSRKDNISEYAAPFHDISVQLISIYGIKVVEMPSFAWLYGSYMSCVWLRYFTETSHLETLAKVGPQSLCYVINASPWSYLDYNADFITHLLHSLADESSREIANPLGPVENPKSYEDISLETYPWLTAFVTLVEKLTSPHMGCKLEDLGSSIDLSFDVHDYHCTVDFVATELFAAISSGTWTDPYAFCTMYNLFFRNAFDRFDEYSDQLDMLPHDLEQFRWRTANTSEVCLDYPTSRKINFLKEAEKAMLVFKKRAEDSISNVIYYELDHFRKAYLMVATSTEPCKELFECLCSMAEILFSCFSVFDAPQFDRFMVFAGSVCRLAFLGDNLAAKIIYTDLTRLNSPERYPFEYFPDETIGLALLIHKPHLHPIMDGLITEIMDSTVGEPVLIQWTLAERWFKEKLRTKKIDQATYDHYMQHKDECINGVISFMNGLSDDRTVYLNRIIDSLVNLFFNNTDVSFVTHVVVMLKDFLSISGHGCSYLIAKYPDFFYRAIEHSSQLLTEYNRSAFSELYTIHGFGKLAQVIGEVSLDEDYTPECLKVITDSVVWIVSQLKEALTVMVPMLLQKDAQVEAGCVISTCLSVICDLYDQDFHVFKWAKVDLEKDDSYKHCNPAIIRVLSEFKIFELWLKAYALFDAEASDQRLFNKYLLDQILIIVSSDSFKTCHISDPVLSSGEITFLSDDIVYQMSPKTKLPQEIQFGNGYDPSNIPEAAIPEEGIDDTNVLANSSMSDSDLLSDAAGNEYRERHRNRIQNASGGVFRNSVLEDFESNSEVELISSSDSMADDDGEMQVVDDSMDSFSDYDSDMSSDDMAMSDDVINTYEDIDDDSLDDYDVEVDFGYDIDTESISSPSEFEDSDSDVYLDLDDVIGFQYEDGDENGMGFYPVYSSVESQSSTDNEDERRGIVSLSRERHSGRNFAALRHVRNGGNPTEDSDNESSDDVPQLQFVLYPGTPHGVEMPEFIHHHHHHNHMNELDTNPEDDELFQEELEGFEVEDEIPQPNTSFDCDCITDTDVWFWHKMFRSKRLLASFWHFFEGCILKNMRYNLAEHFSKSMDVDESLVYEYCIVLKQTGDIKPTMSSDLISTVMRFIYADIRSSEMKRIKNLCQWIMLDDEYRHILVEKLYTTMLNAVHYNNLSYNSIFEEMGITPQIKFADTATPLLVATNILSLLTVLVSHDPNDLYNPKDNRLDNLRGTVAKVTAFKLVGEIFASYSQGFLTMLIEPLVCNNRKLLVCACKFIDTAIKSMEARLKFYGQHSVVKLDINDQILEKLVAILGSMQCNWDIFGRLTNIIHKSVPGEKSIPYLLQQCSITNKALIDSLPVIINIGDDMSMIERVHCIDEFMCNVIRLLRFLSAMQSVQPDSAVAIDSIEKSNILGLWDNVFNTLNDAKLSHHKIGRSTLQALFEIVASPTMMVVESSKNLEAGKQKAFTVQLEKQASKHLSAYKIQINDLIRARPNIIEGPLGRLAQRLKIMDFNSKYAKLKTKLNQIRRKDPRVTLSIKRDEVLEDSFEKIMQLSKNYVRSPMYIHFLGEHGVDAGGVAREWLGLLSRELVNPKNGLFTATTAGSSIHQVNPSSIGNPALLNYFYFTGRIIGRTVLDLRTLGCYFSRVIYKYICGLPIDVSDMESVDNEYHRNLMWILENDITDIIFDTFSVEIEMQDGKKVIDLIPNGRNIAVTEANKAEYVKRIVLYRLVESVEPQLKAIKDGFNEVIPVEYVSDFTVQEFELLVTGLPDIDITEWKRNTVYEGYLPSSPQIKWFWVAVKSFTREERAKLLQFSTGSSHVPPQGFSQLESSEGIGKFSIHRERSSTNRLPSSHTCMNQLMLPQYESYKKLRALLLQAITEGNLGFGFA